MFGNTDNNLKAVQKSYEFIKFKWQGSGDIHNHLFLLLKFGICIIQDKSSIAGQVLKWPAWILTVINLIYANLVFLRLAHNCQWCFLAEIKNVFINII